MESTPMRRTAGAGDLGNFPGSWVWVWSGSGQVWLVKKETVFEI
jgi:hypothetical protein